MDNDVRGVDELLSFQSKLLREKQVLTKLLSKIDEQVHALQVEQLHLLNTMNASMKPKQKPSMPESVTTNKKPEASLKTHLDLSVPMQNHYSEEEDDED